MKPELWFAQELEKYEKDPEVILEGLLFDINEKILEIMDKKKISRTNIADKLGVSPAYITKLLDNLLEGKPNVTLKTLIKITLALDSKLAIELRDHAKIFKFEIPSKPYYEKISVPHDLGTKRKTYGIEEYCDDFAA